MEPTGHYWLNLAHYLREQQVNYGVVNPLQVRGISPFLFCITTRLFAVRPVKCLPVLTLLKGVPSVKATTPVVWKSLILTKPSLSLVNVPLPFTLIQEGSQPQLLDSVQSKLA
ncbi:IS110 family transposase [Paenibacillus sp. PL91]|uniref:IS110 family transposase n=1 Tax=Paenibacillus sp. PL91 TaxID=2729538 RepID=UPI0021D53B0D|nr:IS110 family transposase [Paenibacillus sp. PL91]